MKRSLSVTMTSEMAKAIAIVWVVGVLWEYSDVPKEHVLFYVHVSCMSAAVAATVFGTDAAMRRRSSSGGRTRRRLSRHKTCMVFAFACASIGSTIMLYKKGSEKGLLLWSGRAPSYHSAAALVTWTLFLGLTASGIVMYKNRPPRLPFVDDAVRLVMNTCLCGKSTATLFAPHRVLGLAASAAMTVTAALGLAEKNDKPLRHALAYALPLMWILLVSRKIVSSSPPSKPHRRS